MKSTFDLDLIWLLNLESEFNLDSDSAQWLIKCTFCGGANVLSRETGRDVVDPNHFTELHEIDFSRAIRVHLRCGIIR
jgi:hypothetical protein